MPHSDPHPPRSHSAHDSATEQAEIEAARADAPGAIPPTEGVPPRSGRPSNPETEERSAAEDLADGLELLRRAARKTLHQLDPRIEQIAERAMTRLKQLDDDAQREFNVRRVNVAELERTAEQVGREIASAVERVATRIEEVVQGRGPKAS